MLADTVTLVLVNFIALLQGIEWDICDQPVLGMFSADTWLLNLGSTQVLATKQIY